MKQINSYIIEKLRINKDTKITNLVNEDDPLDMICKISGFDSVTGNFDKSELRKKLKKDFIKEDKKYTLDCVCYSESKIPSDKVDIWDNVIDYINFDKDEFQDTVNKFHKHNGTRVLPLLIYHQTHNHIEYVFSIGGGGHILKADINPDFAPMFNLYFTRHERD